MAYERGRDAVIEVWDYVAKCKRDCWIDACDLAIVSAFKSTWLAHHARKSTSKWYVIGKQYDPGTRKCKTVMFHRLLLGVIDPNVEVHHKDNDGLNNRRSNLELLTHQQNMRERDPRRDWAHLDDARRVSALCRSERLIAKKIQDEFGITRAHMYSIRMSRVSIRSAPSEAYYCAIKAVGLKTLEELQRMWPREGSTWGVMKSGQHC